MRILLVNSSSGIGGAETHIRQLTRGLVERGHEVHVASPSEGPLARAVMESGARHHAAPMFPDRPSVGQVLRIARLVSELEPDVLHLHGIRAGLIGRLALLRGIAVPATPDRPRPGVAYTVHGAHFLHYPPPLDRAYALVERTLQGVTDQTIFVCRADMAACARAGAFDGRRGVVVLNGIEGPAGGGGDRRDARASEADSPLDPVPDLPDSARLLLAVGRLVAPKDHATLLRATASAAERLRALGAAVAIVGDGPLLPGLQALAQTLRLTGSTAEPALVHFLGARDDVPALLARADALVLSSAWEGLPYVVLEAARAGVPTVSTAVGGVPETISHEESGLLVQAGDTEALGRAMARILEDDALRARLGAAAGRRMRTLFAVDRMVRETEAVYVRALRHRRGGYTAAR